MVVIALDAARLAFWLSVSVVGSLVALGVAIACGYATASINRSKGRSPRAGFWLGFCFPLVAVAVAALLPARPAASDLADGVPSRRLLTRVALGVGAAALVVPVAAIVVYTQFINDPEPRLDTNDLADLVGGGDSASTSAAGALVANAAMFASSADTEPTGDTEPTDDTATVGDPAAECPAEAVATDSSTPAETAPASTEPAGTEAAESGEGFDGEWSVTSDSEFGYRVPEILAGVETEAVGRGSEIAGSFTVSGAEVTEGCFVVQVASITSDQSMRDGQFTSRIMETDTYPTSTFVLTEPIALDEVPEVGGDAVTATATGELTLHGVTNPVSFDVTVQAGEGVIGVLGEIPIVFSDYDISDASGGAAQVGDDGVLEFLLAFEPA